RPCHRTLNGPAVTDSQMDLYRSYRRRWIWRLYFAPLAVRFALDGLDLIGRRVSPFTFAVPLLGGIILAALIIEGVRWAGNGESLRAMAANDRLDQAVRIYRQRWLWRPAMVGAGLLLVGLGVSVLLPSSGTLGNLAVAGADCHGGTVCDIYGSFQPD